MAERAVDVGGAQPYRVLIGPRLLASLPEELADAQPFVVTEPEVMRLHGARLGLLADAPCRQIARGEAGKTLSELEKTLEAMAEARLGRDGVLVAFGGGAVGDHAGLAAALYMRGIDVVQCPTTLLSQVDSSVGGKTAVNLEAGKNLAGALHSPRAVFADTETLLTLPAEEIASGLGELLKMALIQGGSLLDLIEARAVELKATDVETLVEAIEMAVRAKASVVERDECEAGPREVLNLGHTFGHAIERVAGFGRVPHGVAVAAGLGLALEASRRLGLLDDPELQTRVADIQAALALPVDLASLEARYELSLDPADLAAAALHDKKTRAGASRLVLPIRAGEVRTGVEVERAFLGELFEAS